MMVNVTHLPPNDPMDLLFYIVVIAKALVGTGAICFTVVAIYSLARYYLPRFTNHSWGGKGLSLSNFTIKKMLFKVTQIEFDFTDDSYKDAICPQSQREIYNNVLNKVWEVEDEGDLADNISNILGWCIISIDYQKLPV